MPNNEICSSPAPRRTPWNKGKLVGAKPPLRPKHVWSIRTRLIIERRIRDLAMFNLAIDSKLRGCDVVALKVEDVAPGGYAIDRATGPLDAVAIIAQFPIWSLRLKTLRLLMRERRNAAATRGAFLRGERLGHVLAFR